MNDAPVLRGISEIRSFFRQNDTPVYFVSATAFNLLGIDRWVRNFTFVNWYDSVRFANWLSNGQGGGDTETGSYTLVGGGPVPTNYPNISRSAGATWVRIASITCAL